MQIGNLNSLTPWYFEYASGKAEVESTVLVRGKTGVIGVGFVKKYNGSPTEEQLNPILSGRISQFFRQRVQIEIDGDKIPASAADALVAELVALFEKHGAGDALSATEKLVPLPDFAAKRHLDLTPAQNLALHTVCPMTMSVGIKK